MTEVNGMNDDNAIMSAGMMLKIARETMGLAESDIAEKMRLSTQTILDIEEDNYRHGYAMIYVRGYLRGYAGLVNVEIDEVLTVFDRSEWANTLRDREQHHVRPEPVAFKAPRFSHRKRMQWLNMSLVVLVLAVIGVWWVGHQSSSHLNPAAHRFAKADETNEQTLSLAPEK